MTLPIDVTAFLDTLISTPAGRAQIQERWKYAQDVATARKTYIPIRRFAVLAVIACTGLDVRQPRGNPAAAGSQSRPFLHPSGGVSVYEYIVGYSNDRTVTVRADSETQAMSRAGNRKGASPIWAERQMSRGEF
jgi:hypothetical protein